MLKFDILVCSNLEVEKYKIDFHSWTPEEEKTIIDHIIAIINGQIDGKHRDVWQALFLVLTCLSEHWETQWSKEVKNKKKD